MPDNKIDIIKRLIEIRSESGLLSKDFAQKAGVDPKNYSSIENGKRTIGKRLINDICKAFNINTIWLLTGEGDKFKTDEFDSYSKEGENTSGIFIQEEVWEVIRLQAKSLDKKDEQITRIISIIESHLSSEYKNSPEHSYGVAAPNAPYSTKTTNK